MIDFSTLDKVAEYKNGELQWLEGRDINAENIAKTFVNEKGEYAYKK